jgi:hypothetical protein
VDFPPDAVMTIGQIGVPGYALQNLTIIDTLGLTDRTVAHNPTSIANSDRNLAHDRRPPPGYLEARGANLQVLPSSRTFGTASAFALRLRDDLWMPLSSANEVWLKEAFAQRGLWWRHLETSFVANRVWADGVELLPRVELAFFDRTPLSGWETQGDATQGQPRGPVPRLQGPINGLVGNRAFNTFGNANGDAAKGSAVSPEFVPQVRDRLVFLVGGGGEVDVGVQLLVDGLAVKVWRGENTEELALIVQDVSEYAGHPCKIRIFDESTGAWGHVIADHFMLMQPR